jgi:hypothetical protein
MMKTLFRKTTLRLSKNLVIAARRRGLNEGKPMRLIVEEALERYLSLNSNRKGGQS